MNIYHLYETRLEENLDMYPATTSDKSSRHHDELDYLRQRIDKMVLVNCAMWELLKEKTGLTDIELKSKVLEVDARDGNVDGKVGATTRYCKNCGKTMHPKHAHCLYCGRDSAPPTVHEGI